MNKKALVLPAGGVKGLAVLGALLQCQDLLRDIKVFSGTSVGAIICFLLACDWKPSEIIDWIELFPLKSFAQRDFSQFLMRQGLCTSERLADYLGHMADKKKISPFVTFKQLVDLNGSELIVCATNVNNQQAMYFSHTTTPDLEIVMALRASVSVPILFQPVLIDNDLYIDGAFVDPIPICPVLKQCAMEDIFCISFTNTKKKQEMNGKLSLEMYLVQLYKCFANINNNSLTDSLLSSSKLKYLRIDVQDCTALDFDIKKDKKAELIELGRLAALNF